MQQGDVDVNKFGLGREIVDRARGGWMDRPHVLTDRAHSISICKSRIKSKLHFHSGCIRDLFKFKGVLSATYIILAISPTGT